MATTQGFRKTSAGLLEVYGISAANTPYLIEVASCHADQWAKLLAYRKYKGGPGRPSRRASK